MNGKADAELVWSFSWAYDLSPVVSDVEPVLLVTAVASRNQNPDSPFATCRAHIIHVLDMNLDLDAMCVAM